MSKRFLELPIEKKIGQLFFIGLSGTQISDATRQLLTDVSPGGVCLFARNIHGAEQTRNFIEEIHHILPSKPFISLDEEGGLVDRLRRLVTPLPAASLIKTTADATALAKITAEIVRMLGFNMNFAPVVDVIDEERESSVNGLYSRAFGKSKEQATELAGVYLDALQKNGCIGCVKHFPGLGASQTDSHEDLPIVNLTREDLYSTDLFPYQNLIETKQVHCVMVAHATYPLLDLQETDADGKLLPSSLSFKIINNLLRREFGFQGIVVSDDLEMGAILKNYGIGDACVMAINAGVDMVSICADEKFIREGFAAVVEAFESGEITETKIDESLARIAQVKDLIQTPLNLDLNRLEILSQEIAELNKKVK